MPTLPPNQLTRHAICLGMTGSGKTVLCVGILEDLALHGVPVLAVDPKGDLANLALVLDPTPEAYAGWVPDPAATAAAWQAGLANAGIADLQAFRDAVDVRVLTPGAESAAPVDVLTALTTAPPGLDDEARRDYIQGAVAALLGLIDHDGDVRTDPAAVFTSTILAHDERPREDEREIAGFVGECVPGLTQRSPRRAGQEDGSSRRAALRARSSRQRARHSSPPPTDSP